MKRFEVKPLHGFGRPLKPQKLTNFTIQTHNVIIVASLCMARNLSDVQEAAQLLGGKDMPVQIMQTLISGTPIDKTWKVAIMNLSPFEGTFELAMLELQAENTNWPAIYMMSATDNIDIARYTEKLVAWHLLQARFYINHKHALQRWSMNGLISRFMFPYCAEHRLTTYAPTYGVHAVWFAHS
jgi:hypothetical protein